VTEPTPLPTDYICPEGTVPGWLNADGFPTSCISDEPMPERTVDPNQPELIPPIDICPFDCGTEQPVDAHVPDELAATGPVDALLPVLLAAALFITALGTILRKAARP
jgi:hypothetical protein